MIEMFWIKDKITNVLTKCLTQKNTEDIRERIKYNLFNELSDILNNELLDTTHIKFDIMLSPKDPSSVLINPKNLFTLLLIYGYYIEPTLLVGISEYNPPNSGLTFGYDEVNGSYSYHSHRTFKRIKGRK